MQSNLKEGWTERESRRATAAMRTCTCVGAVHHFAGLCLTLLKRAPKVAGACAVVCGQGGEGLAPLCRCCGVRSACRGSSDRV
jgi:hypothetical protein